MAWNGAVRRHSSHLARAARPWVCGAYAGPTPIGRCEHDGVTLT